MFLIEPKFDVKFIPSDILYHSTELKYIPKIKKIGLIPKSLSKKSFHPDRIYFSLELKTNDIMVENLKRETNDEIITLTLSDWPKNIEFFKDPKFVGGNACYTYQNIPPSYIKFPSL